MSSVIDPSYQQFLNNVNNLQSLLTKAQNQVSSGLKVTQPSDAPDQISAILQLHANIAQNAQVQTNLASVKAEVQTADASLGTGITLLDQVQTLAAEGLNGSNQTADTRITLAGQIEGLMQQMVSISQTAVNGRYIFSGDSDQTPGYKYDATAPTGVDRLQISDSTRQVQDTGGNTFSVSRSANQIFDVRDATDTPTTGNVFAAMNAVRTALLNNDTTALQTALGQVSSASAYLNQQQSFYGSVENTIGNALDQATTQKLNYQTDLSNKQDADETQSILAMQQYTTNLQAALASEAKIPRQTLFDLMS